MKKQIVAACCVVAMAASLVACGGKDSSTQSGKSQKRSGQIELNADELVTKLGNYDGIEVELSQDYTVTDETINQVYNNILSTASGSYTEVTDRKVIQKEDYVLVDYTGYLDGKAFDNGSATNQYVWVSDNNGYIPGFTDGLVGKEVGETVKYDVTFPDPYQNNTELSGKTTQFEFKIHGIYTMTKLSADTLTDDQVKEAFSTKLGVSTVAELKTYAENYAKQYNEYQKYQESVTAVKSYMLENSEVTVPEEYLDLRLEEYIEQFTKNYVTSDYKNLDDYLQKTYSKTEKEAREEWKTYMTSTIKTELIFEKIAHEEKIEIDEDQMKQYVASMVSNYKFSDENALYESFGNGNKDEGKTYVERLYKINSAIDRVVEKAKTSVKPADTQSTQSTQQS